MLYICATCGSGFKSAASRKRKYCSRKCFGSATKTYMESLQGGSRLHSPESDTKRSQANKVTPKTQHPTAFVCDQCGKTFTAYPARRPRPLKFCTAECCVAYQRAHSKSHVGSVDVGITSPKTSPQKNMTVVLENGELRNV